MTAPLGEPVGDDYTSLILEARKMWWEIVESDEGECRMMGIVRELADAVESLQSRRSTPEDGEAREAAERIVKWADERNRLKPIKEQHHAAYIDACMELDLACEFGGESVARALLSSSGGREREDNSSAAGAGPFAQWQPVDAHPPTDGEKAKSAWGDHVPVLLYSRQLGIVSGTMHRLHGQPPHARVSSFHGNAIDHWGVTHWMSLPAPPGNLGVEDGKERDQIEPPQSSGIRSLKTTKGEKP